MKFVRKRPEFVQKFINIIKEDLSTPSEMSTSKKVTMSWDGQCFSFMSAGPTITCNIPIHDYPILLTHAFTSSASCLPSPPSILARFHGQPSPHPFFTLMSLI